MPARQGRLLNARLNTTTAVLRPTLRCNGLAARRQPDVSEAGLRQILNITLEDVVPPALDVPRLPVECLTRQNNTRANLRTKFIILTINITTSLACCKVPHLNRIYYHGCGSSVPET